MTTNTQSHYCLYWGKILLLGLTLLFAGCRDGDDDSEEISPPPPNPPPKAYQGQAILGPLVDASVEIYTLSTLDSTPIYTATTSNDDRLDQSGLFTIPEDLVDDNELYLIKVTGGQDIDADDNGSMDDNPTANQGTIHALLTPDQIRGSRFHVSILTELLYQRLYYLLAANYPKETVLLELNRRAPLVLAADVDGDGDRDADDVVAWHPARDATKLRHGFEAYQPMIAAVHNGEPLKEMPLTSFVLSSLDITGFANGVAVLDDTAYIAAGEAGLQIVDVRNPTKLIQLGSLSLGSPDTSVYAQDVAVGNGIAYVAVSAGGLKTVDVHDPAKPILLGSLDMPDLWATTVTVVDGIAYLGGSGRLYAVDVHDPAKPLSLGVLDTQNTTPAVVVSDNILYQVTCNYRGLHLGIGPSPVQIYDVHEPGTPTLLAVWDTPTPECGQDIAVVNGVAYLTRGGSLRILDVHDPANPRSLSLLYTEDYTSKVAVTQGFAYLVGPRGIQVVDVRDPTKPTLLGLIENTASGSIGGLSIEDELAYLASGALSGDVPSSRLKVIDISNPFNAVMNSARIGSMGSDYLDVAAVDKTAYVVGRIPGAGMGGLHAIDAQDPTNPVLLGSLGPPYSPSHVAVTHGMAFVTNGNYEGLHAIDVNNPTSPALIKSFSIMSPTDAMTTSDIAYVTTESVTTSDSAGNEVKFPASLYLLDARNPATLEVLGSLSFGGDPSAAKGVAVADGIAYVVVDVATIGGEGINWRGLQVVDARNPAQPVVIGSIPFNSPFTSYISAVAVIGGVAYVVDNVNGLQLVDVHNSSSPFLLRSIPFDSLELPGDARNIAVTDSFAYIAGSAGVQVMDIRDPLNPIHIFSLSTPTAAEAVTISDGYVYVAAGYPSGLQIFQAAVRQVP